jgi:hypothetical protein
MTPECQAAVNALMVTGMDQAKAEKIILDLHRALPSATGIELTLMALEAKRQLPVAWLSQMPNLAPELQDLARIYGAGTFGQQLKQNLRKEAAEGVTAAATIGVALIIWVVIAFTVIFVLFGLIPLWFDK